MNYMGFHAQRLKKKSKKKTKGIMFEASGDVTVKSKAADLPSIHFAARTSAGRLRVFSDPYLPLPSPGHQCRPSGMSPQ